MEKIIVLRVLFAIFVIAAIGPRIIQKLKKVETVGCIGINKKLFFFGKSIALFIVHTNSCSVAGWQSLAIFKERCLFLDMHCLSWHRSYVFYACNIKAWNIFTSCWTCTSKYGFAHNRHISFESKPHAIRSLSDGAGFGCICPESNQLDAGSHRIVCSP
jgi:hypothetical protein